MKTRATKLAKTLVEKTPFEGAAHLLYTRFASRFASEEIRRNIKYDEETVAVLKRVLCRDANCIDVGCYKGRILNEMLKLAPEGIHHAFEPLPKFYQHLVNSYPSSSYPNLRLYELALSDVAGESSFQNVVSDPGYSGFKPRQYPHETVHIEKIRVRTDLLDNIIPPDFPIHFIKIDVEGAELQVLKGARRTIQRNKPVIVFEHGLGGSDYYGTEPEDIYDFLVIDCGLDVSLLERWLRGDKPLTKEDFSKQYHQHINYVFIAYEK